MPIYEFTCADCNYTFDEIMKHDDRADKRECPRCETGVAYRIAARPAQSRGNFGTVRRDISKESPQKFNFSSSKNNPEKGE